MPTPEELLRSRGFKVVWSKPARDHKLTRKEKEALALAEPIYVPKSVYEAMLAKGLALQEFKDAVLGATPEVDVSPLAQMVRQARDRFNKLAHAWEVPLPDALEVLDERS